MRSLAATPAVTEAAIVSRPSVVHIATAALRTLEKRTADLVADVADLNYRLVTEVPEQPEEGIATREAPSKLRSRRVDRSHEGNEPSELGSEAVLPPVTLRSIDDSRQHLSRTQLRPQRSALRPERGEFLGDAR
jgi:hypothetical protein